MTTKGIPQDKFGGYANVQRDMPGVDQGGQEPESTMSSAT